MASLTSHNHRHGADFYKIWFPNVDDLSEIDFSTEVWPAMERLLDHLMSLELGQKSNVTHLEIYRKVYSLVGQGFAEELFENLVGYIDTKTQMQALSVTVLCGDESISDQQFLKMFIHGGKQVYQAAEIVSSLFRYLENLFVKPQIGSSIEQEFVNAMRNNVIENSVIHSRLFGVLEKAADTPFHIDPDDLMCICQHLHHMNPGYASRVPHLFRRFVPVEASYSDKPECLLNINLREAEAFERAHLQVTQSQNRKDCLSLGSLSSLGLDEFSAGHKRCGSVSSYASSDGGDDAC
jgi:hypothetical protein